MINATRKPLVQPIMEYGSCMERAHSTQKTQTIAGPEKSGRFLKGHFSKIISVMYNNASGHTMDYSPTTADAEQRKLLRCTDGYINWFQSPSYHSNKNFKVIIGDLLQMFDSEYTSLLLLPECNPYLEPATPLNSVHSMETTRDQFPTNTMYMKINIHFNLCLNCCYTALLINLGDKSKKSNSSIIHCYPWEEL